MLYSLVQQDDAAGISAEQKNALIQLKHLARSGNTDAGLALSRLRKLPDLHPFIREMLNS